MAATAHALAPSILARPVVSLVIPGEPVAQPRYRHANHRTRSGKTIATSYIPGDHPIWAYRAALQAAARQAGLRPLDCPIILSARFYFSRPKRLLSRRAPDGPIWHTGRPDLSNLIKGLEDALNGTAWMDDSMIVGYGAMGKWYVEKGGQPRTEIQIFLI